MDPKKDLNFEQSISRGQSETIQMESDIENPRTDENCDDAMDGETVSIYHDESMKNRIHKPQKAVILRIWTYLKHAWVGVMRGSSGKPVLEDLELPHRYRPENLQMLCDETGFSVVEMKRIYRGFKTECPTGLITEDVFHGIYSRFFPHGAAFNWRGSDGVTRSSVASNTKMTKKMKKEAQSHQGNLSSYSHYVFSTLDHEDTGVITFEDFVIGLSILLRGSLDDKLRWTFSLYDQDRDGFISREEMEDVVGSVFDLMGRTSDPLLEEEVISERVDTIFEKLDLNGDGVVSMEEFLEACKADETIYQSVDAFTNSVI